MHSAKLLMAFAKEMVSVRVRLLALDLLYNARLHVQSEVRQKRVMRQAVADML